MDFWCPLDFDVEVLRPQKARLKDDTKCVRFGIGTIPSGWRGFVCPGF